MYQLLSVVLLPGGSTLLTYYFLYWRRLLAKTKTEPLPDSKQSRSVSAVPFEVDMFAESKQPAALKQRTWQTTLTDCVMFPLGMSNVNSLVVKACGFRSLTSVPERAEVIALSVWQGEAAARSRISSSDTLLNPIALLVKSCNEMSPHIGLTTGITRAPPAWCLSNEMNSPLRRAKSLDLML